MKGLQDTHPRSAASSHRPRFMLLVGISVCLLFAFVLSAWSGNLPFRAYAASSAHPSTTSTTGNYPIQVYFSKSPDSLSQSTAVFSVDRTSPTIAVATFSIQLLIAGPTLSERNSGYFSELNSILSGSSTCSAPLPTGGPDFTLALNKKGSVTEQGTATLRFCRSTNSGGIGSDGRIQAEINATLKQFSTITKVVLLTKDGHCFGDGSGMDLCLR